MINKFFWDTKVCLIFEKNDPPHLESDQIFYKKKYSWFKHIFYKQIYWYRWRWFRIFRYQVNRENNFPKTEENLILPGKYFFLFFNILSTSIWLSMTLIPNFLFQVNQNYNFPNTVENQISPGKYFFLFLNILSTSKW